MKLFLLTMLMPLAVFASKFTTLSVATNASMGASITSCGVDENQLGLGAYQAVYTGSPVGSLKVQISNDNVGPSPTGCYSDKVTHWSDYTGSTVAISAAGDTMYNMTFAGYRWSRVVYTRTSGTGTLNVVFTGKAQDH